MKSVKSKLFISYSITIFIVLFLLSFSALYIFQKNQETKSLSLLESTYSNIENIILNKIDLEIIELEKNKSIFIIINKNDKLLYSDLSLEKNKNIISRVDYKLKHYNEEDHEYEKYLEVNDQIINYKNISKNNNMYDVYIGINEFILEEFLNDIYSLVLVLNCVLFLVLLVLGYFLINKTINPLKLILEDLEKLQNKKDLSLRLIKQDTNDEFDHLTKSLNNMLEWIENSVENIKQFSSDASHELRTPLTVIQGEIELCKRKSRTKEELDTVLAKVDLEQNKLQNIIKDFLLLSRIDKEVLVKNSTFLDKVVFDVIESNLIDIENKNLELKLNLENNLEINFNEKYLFIVINNLVSNAIKYTEEGFIKIEVKKDSNNKIFFLIEDSGIGIPTKDIPKVFERFYRVDESRTNAQNGIGLGLPIVKKICERFDCSIEIKSELNKGSTFIFSKRNS